MTAATSQKLADVLRAAGFITLADHAEKDEFHDFLSPYATPAIALDKHLVAIIQAEESAPSESAWRRTISGSV